MVWIEGGAATQADAKRVRRPPDLEGAAGLPASMAGGGAGTTSGSGEVGSGAVVIAATGVVVAASTAAGVVGTAGSITGCGGVGGPALRGAAPTAPGEAGIAFASLVGAVGGAATEPYDRQGRGEERDALGGGRAARKGRGREEGGGLKVPCSQGRRVHGLSQEVGRFGPRGVWEETRAEKGRGNQPIKKGKQTEVSQYRKRNLCLTANDLTKAHENMFCRGLRASRRAPC